MRIRTIKPEFWNHPVLSRLDDSIRLTCIGLLSYADDEGFFFAEPALVRGALFPFDEDSTKIRRIIEELSKEPVFFIQLFDSKQGRIGQVINFKKHQKIDRPQVSKIKQYVENVDFIEHSTNIRRTFDEHSLPEQGTGNKGIREQGNKGGEILNFVDSEIFQKVKSFFHLTETRNPNDLIDLNRFLNLRQSKGNLDEFIRQFPAYCEFKSISKQATHSFKSFIGLYDDSGGWMGRDWCAELTKLHVEKTTEKADFFTNNPFL